MQREEYHSKQLLASTKSPNEKYHGKFEQNVQVFCVSMLSEK